MYEIRKLRKYEIKNFLLKIFMIEPTSTLTAVKTKTVTRTQLAIALACLGASIIAAAAMSIAVSSESATCTGKGNVGATLILGQATVVTTCKGQTIVPTAGFGKMLVRTYNDNTLTLLIDKKYVTFKVGEDYRRVGKPVGEVAGYQQYLYVMYGGKINKRAEISLSYGNPVGKDGTFCWDTDQSQKNFDGSAVKDFQFINPYVKGTASYYDEDTDEMVPVEDACIAYDYAYYGASWPNNLQEGYCSTADGGKWFSKVIGCEGGCVDGACLPVVASSTVPMATSTLSIKTCDDGMKLANEYFTLCKQHKLEGVCLNKYSLFFQMCTDLAGSECLVNNPHAADNMLCPTTPSSTPQTATSTLTITSENMFSAPNYSVSGKTVYLGKFIFATSTEAVKIKSIKFSQLVTDSKFSVPSDIKSLWLVEQNSGMVLSGEFAPYNQTPLVEINKTNFIINAGETKTILLMGIVNDMVGYVNGPAYSGHSVDYKIAESKDVSAVSVSTGQPVAITLKSSADSIWQQNYIFRAYPQLTVNWWVTNKLGNGTRDLIEFKVTAVNNDISLYKLDFIIQLAKVKLSNLYLYDVTDSNHEVVVNDTAGGLKDNGNGEYIWYTSGSDWKTSYPAQEIVVSKTQPRTFVLRGNVSEATTGSAIATMVRGPEKICYTDSSGGGPMSAAKIVEGSGVWGNGEKAVFIWSDRSVALHGITSKDWTNGCGVHDILTGKGSTFSTIAY